MGRIDILIYDLFILINLFITSFTIFMSVQLICYRGFKFNLYKTALRFVKKQIRI